MSKGLPVPVRPARRDVVVVDSAPSPQVGRRAGALARLAVSLTPEVLDAVERSMAQRRSASRRPEPEAPASNRAQTRAVQYSELEINTWSPFPRRVRVRTETHWSTSTPVAGFSAVPNDTDERAPRLRRAGMSALGVGGALAIATLGVLANRGGLLRRR